MNEAEKAGNVFDEMGIYWAEIADENSTKRQIQFIKNTVKKDGLILDLACGTGRHTNPLTMEGYNIVGLDVSSTLLRIAKNRSIQAQLVKADMQHLPFKPKAFSSAVSMDTSFGYLPSEKADLQSLTELRKSFCEGGLLIFDVFNREHLIRKYKTGLRHRFIAWLKWIPIPILLKLNNSFSKSMLFNFFKWKEYPSFFLLQKRTVSSNGESLCDLWVIYDKAKMQIMVFNHVARLYEFNRLHVLLGKAGFLVNRVYGDYEGQNFSIDSSRLIVVASAK